jgi:transposase
MCTPLHILREAWYLFPPYGVAYETRGLRKNLKGEGISWAVQAMKSLELRHHVAL